MAFSLEFRLKPMFYFCTYFFSSCAYPSGMRRDAGMAQTILNIPSKGINKIIPVTPQIKPPTNTPMMTAKGLMFILPPIMKGSNK